MAIDFDAIRKKLDRLSGNNRSRNVMWRPTEGEEEGEGKGEKGR